MKIRNASKLSGHNTKRYNGDDSRGIKFSSNIHLRVTGQGNSPSPAEADCARMTNHRHCWLPPGRRRGMLPKRMTTDVKDLIPVVGSWLNRG